MGSGWPTFFGNSLDFVAARIRARSIFCEMATGNRSRDAHIFALIILENNYKIITKLLQWPKFLGPRVVLNSENLGYQLSHYGLYYQIML